MSIFTTEDVGSFRSDRLMAVARQLMPGLNPSDAYLLGQIKSAEAEVCRQLDVFDETTIVFSYEPTQDDIDAVPSGTPWYEEPAYDWGPGFFKGDSWGYLQLNKRPMQSVAFVRFAYPNPTAAFFTLPHEWIRLDKKHGVCRFIPATASFSAPLNAFILQAMGGGQVLPQTLQVKYTAGLVNARRDWPDLVNAILAQASVNVVRNLYLPQSGSVSVDGMSTSLSLDMEKYQDDVDRMLYGPKGVNGGLRTALHGAMANVLGMLA